MHGHPFRRPGHSGGGPAFCAPAAGPRPCQRRRRSPRREKMPILLQTILLLILSNIFMTLAWYGHLGELKHKPLLLAVGLSWGIALFEYLLQVPANRIGNTEYSISKLKILQEAISL